MERDDRRPDFASSVEVATECACFNVRKAARAVTQLYDATLEPSGLRATQFSILVAMHLAGVTTITRLARETVMDRTTLTRNLKPLAKRALVEISTGRDRRRREIRLTAAGRRALADALPLWREVQRRVVDGFEDRRWHRLMSDLGTIVAVAHGS